MRVDWLELKVPPLALTVAAATVIVAASYVQQRPPPIDAAIAYLTGSGLAFAGLALAAWGVVDFRLARTTVDPRHPERTARIVTHGIYRFSRNPMYLGFVLLLLGLAIALQSAVGLPVTAVAASFLHRFQIAPEERWLSERFGAEYVAYRARVRRWL